MPWDYLSQLLGPGIHWGRPPEEWRLLIEQAIRDDRPDAAEHLKIMANLRDKVMFDRPSESS